MSKEVDELEGLVQTLRDDNDVLKVEVERLTALIDTDVMVLATELQEEVEEVGRLKQKQRKYGKHNSNCNSLHSASVDGDPGDMTCDCGFDEEGGG